MNELPSYTLWPRGCDGRNAWEGIAGGIRRLPMPGRFMFASPKLLPVAGESTGGWLESTFDEHYSTEPPLSNIGPTVLSAWDCRIRQLQPSPMWQFESINTINDCHISGQSTERFGPDGQLLVEQWLQFSHASGFYWRWTSSEAIETPPRFTRQIKQQPIEGVPLEELFFFWDPSYCALWGPISDDPNDQTDFQTNDPNLDGIRFFSRGPFRTTALMCPIIGYSASRDFDQNEFMMRLYDAA